SLAVMHCSLVLFPTRRSSDLGERDEPDVAIGAGGLELRQRAVVEILERLIECDALALGVLLFGGHDRGHERVVVVLLVEQATGRDRKSTRLNSSHVKISYAVC